ncbi:hypothetical protein [Actinoplanes sp. HUAS TT8]|uniref:hypothetical protein n=1 Tax=Actinoplanes sp. HUAS TT8 TaxID=3447453 RepID=UPI003F51E590
MTRRPREQVFRELMAAWHLPEPDEIRRGRQAAEAVYRGGGLRRHLRLLPGTHGRLRWNVLVFDDELAPLVDTDFFTAWVFRADEPLVAEGSPPVFFHGEYRWPEVGRPAENRLVVDGLLFAGRLLWCLADRAELGRLLIAGEWTRDDITARRLGGDPMGTVAAVIIARRIGDTELERLALARIGGAGPVAAQAAAWSPVDISDLVTPVRRRGRGPEK